MAIKHAAVKTPQSKGLSSEWNADHKIDGDVDFDNNQALSLAIENRTSFPAGPVVGQVIYRSDLTAFYVWSGAAWQTLATAADIAAYVTANVPFLTGETGRWACAGCNFDVHESTYAWWKNNGYFTARSNSILAYASVEGLPDGVSLTSAYVSGTAGKTWILYRKNFVTNVDTVIATTSTNSAYMISPAEVVDNSTYAYYIRVATLDINELIFGARIAYTYP